MGIRVSTLLMALLFSLFSVQAFSREITAEEFAHIKADYDFLTALVNKLENQWVSNDTTFSTYQKSYRSYVGQLQAQTSSRLILAEQLKQSRLVLYGDEHSNRQSQENINWVMEQMSGSGEKFLVIEWIEKRFQNHLNDFMNGVISEEDLKINIQFDSTWGFSWASHIEILRTAKKLGFHVVAAENKVSETSGTPAYLRHRDNRVANVAKKILSENNQARVFIAYGENHLAGGIDGHLREKLSRLGYTPDVIIYPRIGDGYWQVLNQTLDLDKAEVLRYSPSEFYLDQGTVLRTWGALKYYFSQLGLGEQHLNFVKSKLTSEEFTQRRAESCRSLFSF